jgi:hypothetical protein
MAVADKLSSAKDSPGIPGHNLATTTMECYHLRPDSKATDNVELLDFLFQVQLR